jgi:hypothetical protein
LLCPIIEALDLTPLFGHDSDEVSTNLDGLKAGAGCAQARLKSIGVPVP